MSEYSDSPSRFPLRRVVIAALALLLIVAGVAAWSARRAWQKPDALLTSPALALESLQAKALYFNNAARPALIAQRADLLTKEDLDEDSDRTRAFTQAALVPKLFRQLDRQYRFDALLLSGDPSQYRALLDHLVATKDWKLRYADHTSLVFRRDGAGQWELADFAPVRVRLERFSPDDRATAFAQTASKLIAAGRPEPAHELLEEAVKLAPRNPAAANGLAIYHMERAQWREAAEQIEKALKADPKFLPALATKTQFLYGTRRYNEAFELSQKLIEKLPLDPSLLFYHAKIAHEANAFKSEIAALEKLITWAEIEGRPTGGYQVYLGQAYASMGDARRSIDSYMLALNDPDLPNDQRQFVRENILRIKKRTGN